MPKTNSCLQKKVWFKKYRHKLSLWITNGILTSNKQRDKIHLSLIMLIASRGNKEYNVIQDTLHSYKSMLKKIIRLSKRKYNAEQFETRQIWGIWKLRPAYSPERPNLGQNWWYVLYRVTLKFDGWPWKTIGHLFFAVSSLQHFIAISEFKLELLSGNAQFGSNSKIFSAVWPWNLTHDLEKQ